MCTLDLLSYFREYYLHLDKGYVYLVTNYTAAALIPFLLSASGKRDRWGWVRLAGKMLLACVGMELWAALSNALLGSADDAVLTGGGLLLILFTLFERERPAAERTALSYAYAGTYVNVVALLVGIGMIYDEPNQILQMVLSFATLVILPAVVAAYRKVTWSVLEESWYLIPLGIFGTVGYVFGCCGAWMKINAVVKLPLYILMIVFQMAVYFVTYLVNVWFQQRQQDHIQQVLRSADESMLAVLKSNLETYSKIRHDMNNHYILMKNLLERKEYDKLQAYFAEFSDLMTSPIGVTDCGNQTVTVILNMEQEKAKRADTELRVKVAVPAEMGFADTDLCSLLTNLIDNAIEYAVGRLSPEQRIVEVEMRMVRRNLLLAVKNPVLSQDEERALALRTTKEDRRLHGLGSKLVASVVDSYGGVLRYQAENGWFVVDAMLTEPEGR